MKTPDLFEGVFDNRATGYREVWMNGKPGRHVHKRSVGTDESKWPETHAPWGTYPDLPANASIATTNGNAAPGGRLTREELNATPAGPVVGSGVV